MEGKAHMAIGGSTTQPGEDVSSVLSVLGAAPGLAKRQALIEFID